MNWKRGLKRLWLLAAIPWMIYAFGEYDAAREISNAWRYYTDHEALPTQQPTTTSKEYDDAVRATMQPSLAQSTSGNPASSSGNPYLDALNEQEALHTSGLRASATLGMDNNPDEIARQKRIASLLGSPVAAVQALPQDAERAVKMKELEQNTANAPVLKQKYTDADFMALAHDTQEPNFDWAIPVLLLPTFGVAFVALALWLTFLTLRWAWRGFQS